MDNLVFEVPEFYKSGLLSGTLERFGTIIKDSHTGQIVAHLQESGIGSIILHNSPLGLIEAGVNAATSLYMLKAMEMLKMLQYASIGFSVVGIGVSAIGFMAMSKRLESIENKLEGISKQIEHGFKDQIKRDFRAHFSKIRGLLKQADQAHELKNPAREWRDLASKLADESAFFYGEITNLLKNTTFNQEEFAPLLQSYILCNSGRIACLMLSNELENAYRVSSDYADEYSSLLDDITPVYLARKTIENHAQWGYKLSDKVRDSQIKTQEFVRAIRDLTEYESTKPYLIHTLLEKGINGRLYMNAIREEKNRPLLMLSA